MKKLIIISLIITGCFSLSEAVFLHKSTITADGGVLDYQAGKIYVGTPVLSTEAVNKQYIDSKLGYNIHIASPIVSNLCEGAIKVNYAITIDTVSAVMINNEAGDSYCIFHLYETDSNGANEVAVLNSSFTATGNQSQDQWYNFDNATLDAGDWLTWEIISISTHTIPSLDINIKHHRP